MAIIRKKNTEEETKDCKTLWQHQAKLYASIVHPDRLEKKKFFCLWHRQAGKDTICILITIRLMLTYPNYSCIYVMDVKNKSIEVILS